MTQSVLTYRLYPVNQENRERMPGETCIVFVAETNKGDLSGNLQIEVVT